VTPLSSLPRRCTLHCRDSNLFIAATPLSLPQRCPLHRHNAALIAVTLLFSLPGRRSIHRRRSAAAVVFIESEIKIECHATVGRSLETSPISEDGPNYA
jgi:hypothetical protein